MLNRTRVIFLSAVAALLILAVACTGDSEDAASSDANTAPPGVGADGEAQDDLAALRTEGGMVAELSTSGQASGTDAGAPATSELQNVLDRKIIQSTSIDIEVTEVGRNFEDIIRIAQTAGGFVASSSFSNVEDGQIADITIRVPADRYQDVLGQIRGMGEVAQEGSEANDITEEFTDLQARLRTLEATELRYLELLGQADTVNDILLVQDRLDGVRGQIEQVQGRTNLLNELTDLATITVHLRPVAIGGPPAGGLHPLEAAAGAWDVSLATLRVLATVVLVVAVFSWWLLPPLAALGIGARWWQSRRARPAAGTSI